MAIVDLHGLPENGVLLGLDPGQRTIGLASSDTLRMVATPVGTLQRGKRLAPVLDRLVAIIDEREAVGLVIGLPLNMDGSSGPRAQSARALAYNIRQRRDLPIAFQDELLSSVQAERAMIEADLSRARRAELIDASAAAVILQTALDRLVGRAS